MPIPNVSGALRGWTTSRTVKSVTKTVENHRVTEKQISKLVDMLVQPMPKEQVQRKPEEQRSWKWFTVLVPAGQPALSIDDVIEVGSVRYRVESKKDWSEAGFQRYDAVEDYTSGP